LHKDAKSVKGSVNSFSVNSFQKRSASEMTYIVSSGALNSTHSLTHFQKRSCARSRSRATLELAGIPQSKDIMTFTVLKLNKTVLPTQNLFTGLKFLNELNTRLSLSHQHHSATVSLWPHIYSACTWSQHTLFTLRRSG